MCTQLLSRVRSPKSLYYVSRSSQPSVRPAPWPHHPRTDSAEPRAEVRIRGDTIPTVNIALAVEGVGWTSPDYFPMLVVRSVFGAPPLLESRLSHIISANSLANSYMSFSTSYSDTGLWGIYFVSENLVNLDDLVTFTLREWTRMSTAPTKAEVERAKSQLKAALLLGLDVT